MTYLIIGCGNLGSELAVALRSAGHRVVASYCTAKPKIKAVECLSCDVTDPAQTKHLIDRCGTDMLTVFWFAASHNVDIVQSNPSAASRVNIQALEAFLAQYSSRIERFFFSSSDCIYGVPESDAPVDESAPTMPICEYGKQKRAAEIIVEQYHGISLRFSLLIGKSCSGRQGFASTIETHLKRRMPLALIQDSRRCVLSFQKAAQLLVRLLELKELPPVINICSDEFLSKYEIGKRMAKSLHISADLLVPVLFDEQREFARIRVKSIRLDNSLLHSLIGFSFIESGL